MATLHESKIQEALDKACDVGIVEESFNVMGCNVVLCNLRPEAYQEVVDETRDLEDVNFAYAYQMGHICRSIVELGELDLRGIDFVETELPDSKNPGKTKQITLERHEWLRKKILPTWGKEALATIYRKFADVLELADRKASSGVTFIVPDETPEDKFRRLLGEAKELEEALPDDLVAKILDDSGYGRRITPSELEAAQKSLGGSVFKKEVETDDPIVNPATQEAFKTPEGRAALAEAVSPSPNATPSIAEVPTKPDPRELMLRRKPLNQEVLPAQPMNVAPVVTAKSREYAELEASAAMDGVDLGVMPERPREVPELSRPMSRETQQVEIDAPPVVGLNPRFRPPPQRM